MLTFSQSTAIKSVISLSVLASKVYKILSVSLYLKSLDQNLCRSCFISMGPTFVSVLNSVAVISLTDVSKIVVTIGFPLKVTESSVDSVSVT